ncbi:GNAT family N-acetyltransferase [Siccirubricoccus sp. G192]|uniref:GNAT family N-acetyltransferase n=1 Tax=Siccirubricoccus sp. G192 TaxID=2849651 RepID=UPI001C2C7695|nr:GNAT family N-acetyltransferase [Siccirubricoccus sp. G192]MBV1798891.1 GNAT family N-acetyltransferase [Siccirubricoccus sp. G192]
MEAANYSAAEVLRDGRRIEIRALRPADRDGLLAAVGRTSAESLYRRFFSMRKSFSEREIAGFLDIDFGDHVALVAMIREGEQAVIAGGGRYAVIRPGTAEVAFVVVDQYQGQGIGATLMRHLVVIARSAGLRELVAEVLAGNAAMLKVLRKSGLPQTTETESGVVHVTLRL